MVLPPKRRRRRPAPPPDGGDVGMRDADSSSAGAERHFAAAGRAQGGGESSAAAHQRGRGGAAAASQRPAPRMQAHEADDGRSTPRCTPHGDGWEWALKEFAHRNGYYTGDAESVCELLWSLGDLSRLRVVQLRELCAVLGVSTWRCRSKQALVDAVAAVRRGAAPYEPEEVGSALDEADELGGVLPAEPPPPGAEADPADLLGDGSGPEGGGATDDGGGPAEAADAEARSVEWPQITFGDNLDEALATPQAQRPRLALGRSLSEALAGAPSERALRQLGQFDHDLVEAYACSPHRGGPCGAGASRRPRGCRRDMATGAERVSEWLALLQTPPSQPTPAPPAVGTPAPGSWPASFPLTPAP
eukprot:TRINITY_DN55614_c0_g1_i1.p1 TRINITY_DN55614_c0_g1~~TRINITY_DN55614_c0_g1_i1.p1  ORF type:complete len:398 (+),score=66.63 TRINITY_DN55614_c0_g1_i1:113-1195(+)